MDRNFQGGSTTEQFDDRRNIEAAAICHLGLNATHIRLRTPAHARLCPRYICCVLERRDRFKRVHALFFVQIAYAQCKCAVCHGASIQALYAARLRTAAYQYNARHLGLADRQADFPLDQCLGKRSARMA